MGVLLLCLVTFFFSGLLAKPNWAQLETYTFEQYLRDFEKVYSEKELLFRKKLFETRLISIRKHNSDASKTWKLGVNSFTDQTEIEQRRVLGYRKDIARTFKPQETHAKSFRSTLLGAVPPNQVDWRDSGVVSPVKDQGRCGSCWSFGSAQAVESHAAITTGRLHLLSQQQILDCTNNSRHCGGTGGCGGGISELAFEMIINKGGIASEWTYPYISYFGTNYNCSFDSSNTRPVVQLDGYVQLPENNLAALLNAVAFEGPISISVDAGAWHYYEGGVFDGCNQTSPDINHVVLLVGYGVDSVTKIPYWLVKNSWSPTWGENGYIRLRRETSESEKRCGVDLAPQDGSGCDGGPPAIIVCGTCGILSDSAYPLIKN